MVTACEPHWYVDESSMMQMPTIASDERIGTCNETPVQEAALSLLFDHIDYLSVLYS